MRWLLWLGIRSACDHGDAVVQDKVHMFNTINPYRCILSTATIMGSCPSALEVAANYDGAGKVVVITGANSGIGELDFRLQTPTILRRYNIF